MHRSLTFLRHSSPVGRALPTHRGAKKMATLSGEFLCDIRFSIASPRIRSLSAATPGVRRAIPCRVLCSVLFVMTMRIEVRKVGPKLDSRRAGREAFLALQSTVRTVREGELLTLDFTGGELLTPSLRMNL